MCGTFCSSGKSSAFSLRSATTRKFVRRVSSWWRRASASASSVSPSISILAWAASRGTSGISACAAATDPVAPPANDSCDGPFPANPANTVTVSPAKRWPGTGVCQSGVSSQRSSTGAMPGWRMRWNCARMRSPMPSWGATTSQAPPVTWATSVTRPSPTAVPTPTVNIRWPDWVARWSRSSAPQISPSVISSTAARLPGQCSACQSANRWRDFPDIL